jgi:ABC-type iron transport system FetAB permease component
MMTEKFISGVTPNVAVRYQIMVMWMLFSSGSIAAVIYLLSREQITLKHELYREWFVLVKTISVIVSNKIIYWLKN